jgi:hypothetical protein
MNNALDFLNSNSDQSLDQRLAEHPELRLRLLALVDVIEAAAGDCVTAAEAEARVLQEIRQIGVETLMAWSQRADTQAQSRVPKDQAKGDGKKNSTGIRSSAKSR